MSAGQMTDVPAGTEQTRAGGNFIRTNTHGGVATDTDRQLFLLVDGRHIADVWEAVPGSWSTTGVAGYRTGFGSIVEAEDAVIAAYHRLPFMADYEIDVLHPDGQWCTAHIGRTGVDVARLSALGVKAREIAVAYQSLRNLPVRVTLWSTTAPTSCVTTYAEYHLEEPMSEQPGQGQIDPLTVDPAAPATGRVSVDWSTLGQADRVWRVNPATGQPQGLTVEQVNADTVSGQLDDGTQVTLPKSDIEGRVVILEDEASKLLRAGGKSNMVQELLLRLVSDPDTIVWSVDLKGDDQARIWAGDRSAEREAAVRRAFADPEELVIGLHADGTPATWKPQLDDLPPRFQLDPDSQPTADQHRSRPAGPLTWVYVPERKWMSPASDGAEYDHVLEVDADGAWSGLSHGDEAACKPSRARCTVADVMGQAAGLGLPPGRYLVGVNDLGDRLLIGDRIG